MSRQSYICLGVSKWAYSMTGYVESRLIV